MLKPEGLVLNLNYHIHEPQKSMTMATAMNEKSTVTRFNAVKYRDVEKKVEASSRHEAFVLFENAKKRLNDINNWQLLCGKTPAEFHLTDNMGNLLSTSVPQTGNLIRVRCYDKGRDKFIWYRIEEFIHEKNLLKDTEDFGFKVALVSDPSSSHQSEEGITCTFVVTRSGCKVSAVEAERSRIIATDGIPVLVQLKDKLQNVFSWINSSNQQWKSLINGVLQY
jgi:hypothetical protein